MFKVSLIVIALLVAACNSRTERASVTATDGRDGRDGTSCSVAPEYSYNEEEFYQLIGSRISCTDGSYSIVYNGEQGQQGVQGPQGEQGIQGPVGQTGVAGASCQAYSSHWFDGVWLSCPNQFPVLISNGKDGKNGKDGDDGKSCTSVRQDSQHRVKITCGSTVTYVYDGQDGEDGQDGKNGKDGKNGTSCTAVAVSGGANITCGNNASVFLANGATGPAGTQGPQGQPGRDGLNGQDGEDAIQPGLSCNVHDLKNWDGVTNILTVLAASTPVGNFVLPNLNVGDSPSINGFPGMPSSIQNIVGVEGYALDCSGYLNIETSGIYNFSTLSDDGIRLDIDHVNVINNPGLHAPTTDTKSNVELLRGPRAFNVIYYQGPNTQIALQLKYSGPNLSTQVVPTNKFTH